MKMNEYAKFYRLYTQHLRKYYGFSQQDLARSIKISNSSLSKIEVGKQEMDEKTFKKVISFFEKIDDEFHFDFDPLRVDEIEEWIQKGVNAFVMMTYDAFAFEMKEILEDPKYLCSFAYFHRQILEYLYDNFKDIDCMEEVKDLIDIGYFEDDYHLAVLYDLYGVAVYSMDKKVLDWQRDALNTALGHCYKVGSEGLHGLILYHLIMNQKISGNTIFSLEHFDECEHYLQKAGAYRRLIYLELNKVNIYAELHLYPLAEKIFEMLKNTQSQIDEKSINSKIYGSYSWCALIQRKYEEAVEKAHKAIKLGSHFPDLYITIAYGNYKLGNIDTAKQTISRFRNQFHSDSRADFINLFFSLLEKVLENKRIPDYLIERMLKKLPNYRDVDLEMILYPFLIEYYQSNKEWKNASLIQDQYIDYLHFPKA